MTNEKETPIQISTGAAVDDIAMMAHGTGASLPKLQAALSLLALADDVPPICILRAVSGVPESD